MTMSRLNTNSLYWQTAAGTIPVEFLVIGGGEAVALEMVEPMPVAVAALADIAVQ